jgi:hypothetical protein
MQDQANSEELLPDIRVEQKLRRFNQEWVDALVQGDTVTLNRLMDEGCMFTYALEGDDRAQFIADIESGELKVKSLKRDNVEVRIYGSTGVLIAHDDADWRYKGSQIKGHYRTIQVYAEREGNWQIVAIQSSPLPSD